MGISLKPARDEVQWFQINFWNWRPIVEMSRNRLVAILLMPLLIISIFPLLVSAVTQVSSGWVAFVSVFNAFCACVDLLLTGSILFQIPATAIVRFKSWRILWREHDTFSV
jgi:hypothetical protein